MLKCENFSNLARTTFVENHVEISFLYLFSKQRHSLNLYGKEKFDLAWMDSSKKIIQNNFFFSFFFFILLEIRENTSDRLNDLLATKFTHSNIQILTIFVWFAPCWFRIQDNTSHSTHRQYTVYVFSDEVMRISHTLTTETEAKQKRMNVNTKPKQTHTNTTRLSDVHIHSNRFPDALCL